MLDALWAEKKGLWCLLFGLLVLLVLPGAPRAADVPVEGKIHYRRSGEIITLEKVEASALSCRRGPFLFEIPLETLQEIQVDPSSDQLRLLLQNGNSCNGPIPTESFRAQWALGPLVKAWDLIDRIELEVSTIGETPAEPSNKEFSATLIGEGDLSVRALGDLRVEDSFTLWDPVRQRHETGLLPLQMDGFTYLIELSSVREVLRKGRVYSIFMAAGEEYEGELGEGILSGDSSLGPFKVPLRGLKRIERASLSNSDRAAPPGQRATVELASGQQVEAVELSFFYERYLLEGWTETGGSLIGGFRKPFFFVQVGETREMASFAKLSRLEIPEGEKGDVAFRSQAGELFRLPVDWEYHAGFEDLSGEGNYYNPGGYALRRIGFLGSVTSGVFVYFPLENVRAVSFEGV
jgi:hypothetical protein